MISKHCPHALHFYRFDPNYPHALDQFSIMHYFELSPFFDRTCNNTIARQQGHDPAVPGALE